MTKAIAYPRNQQFINTEGLPGHPTREFAQSYEDVVHQINKLREAADDYTALDTGTATTAQIAAALNALMATLVAQ